MVILTETDILAQAHAARNCGFKNKIKERYKRCVIKITRMIHKLYQKNSHNREVGSASSSETEVFRSFISS